MYKYKFYGLLKVIQANFIIKGDCMKVTHEKILNESKEDDLKKKITDFAFR